MAVRVCPMCRMGEHMLQARAHPYWDNGELPPDVTWTAEELCGCDCARVVSGPVFVDVHLPPFDGPVEP